MIYLDNSATTQVKTEVKDVIIEYLDKWENPSSLYSTQIKQDLNNARYTIAKSINADLNQDNINNEIIFTSGGCEADNLAIRGYIEANNIRHIITTKIEHTTILQLCQYLETQGISVTYLNVNEYGYVDLEELYCNLILYRYVPTLVSVMMANNELGTIQNIQEICALAHHHNAVVHTDAVQAFPHIKIDVQKLNIDLMSVSGHKIGAPKGIGFLYKKPEIKLSPIIYGHQENNMRGGTENVPYIMGLSKAVELLEVKHVYDYEHVINNKRYNLWHEIAHNITDVKCNNNAINHDVYQTIPSILNICIKGVFNENLVYDLGQLGYCISNGSACNSGSLEPSAVLKAIGLTDDECYQSVRISIDNNITYEQINKFVQQLKIIVDRERNISNNYQY